MDPTVGVARGAGASFTRFFRAHPDQPIASASSSAQVHLILV